MSYIVVHYVFLSYDFSPKIVTFVFAKYDSRAKDIFRALIWISSTLNSHTQSNGLTLYSWVTHLGYVIWAGHVTIEIGHTISVYYPMSNNDRS
jgi:hypothetical protein